MVNEVFAIEANDEAKVILQGFSVGPGGGMHFAVRSGACALPGQSA
jgi:hypothetical protein